MAYELKDGSGTLFRNDKDGNDKRPDYRGELKLLNGETIKLAGWIKDGAKGKFLSLSVDKPREQTDAGFPGGRSEGVSGGGGNRDNAQSGRGGTRSAAFDVGDDFDSPF